MPRRFFLYGVCLLFTLLAVSGLAAPPKKKANRSGPAGKVDWAGEVRFDFQEMPLREAFALFAETEGFAFFLDRRVDTEIPVTLSVDSKPLFAAMSELARSAGLDAVRVGSSILYVGPAGSGGELLLLTAAHRGELSALELRYTPSKNEGVLFPSDLLNDAADQIGASWSGLGSMPFDCWRADELAPLSYRELFSLVLIGYGVDYQVGGPKEKPVLKPVKIDRAASVTRQWPAVDAQDLNLESYESLSITAVRNELRVAGPFGTVAKLEYLAAQNRQNREAEAESAARAEISGVPPFDETRTISGEVRQTTLKTLSDRLKKDLGVELRLDPSLDPAGITMQTRVSCQFRSADARRAVRIIADELGADFVFQGNAAVLRKK